MIFKKLIQLYAAVDYTKCACKHQVYSSEVHQLALFSSFYVEFSVQILVKTASIDNMFLVFFFYLFFFLSAKLGGLRACRLTPPHLMRFACYCVEQQQTIFITNYSLFLQRCVIELPCMLDMYGFCFLFFSFSVLEDVLFVG